MCVDLTKGSETVDQLGAGKVDAHAHGPYEIHGYHKEYNLSNCPLTQSVLVLQAAEPLYTFPDELHHASILGQRKSGAEIWEIWKSGDRALNHRFFRPVASPPQPTDDPWTASGDV